MIHCKLDTCECEFMATLDALGLINGGEIIRSCYRHANANQTITILAAVEDNITKNNFMSSVDSYYHALIDPNLENPHLTMTTFSLDGNRVLHVTLLIENQDLYNNLQNVINVKFNGEVVLENG